MGEACGVVDVIADEQGFCNIGIYNSNLGMALRIRYKKEQLPWLTNWQHWGTREYVTALEPGTNPPIGQNQARRDKTLMFLDPGQSKTYELEFEILTDTRQIQDFIKSQVDKTH